MLVDGPSESLSETVRGLASALRARPAADRRPPVAARKHMADGCGEKAGSRTPSGREPAGPVSRSAAVACRHTAPGRDCSRLLCALQRPWVVPRVCQVTARAARQRIASAARISSTASRRSRAVVSQRVGDRAPRRGPTSIVRSPGSTVAAAGRVGGHEPRSARRIARGRGRPRSARRAGPRADRRVMPAPARIEPVAGARRRWTKTMRIAPGSSGSAAGSGLACDGALVDPIAPAQRCRRPGWTAGDVARMLEEASLVCSTSPRQAPVSLPRASMNVLNRSMSPLTRPLTSPRASPMVSIGPSGSTSSWRLTRSRLRPADGTSRRRRCGRPRSPSRRSAGPAPAR